MPISIYNPTGKRRPPAGRCYLMLAPECPGGMAFIPACFGGVQRGPEGCTCYDCGPDIDAQIEDLTERLEFLKAQRAMKEG